MNNQRLSGVIARRTVPATVMAVLAIAASAFPVPQDRRSAGDALSGFDDRTNGYISQAEFDQARGAFNERETISEGLGPIYNAESCAACHGSPVSGGVSQISELRAGHLDAAGVFVSARGGSLIHDRAISPDIQPHVSDLDNIRAFRATPTVLGLGYIEAIDDTTLVALAGKQSVETGGRIAGQIVQVPVLEASGTLRVGRFGWKNQHASLLSFVADAYVNEMGITNRLMPAEMDSATWPVWTYDRVPDPEDNPDRPIGEQDIDLLATFIRATKAPEPDRVLGATADARAGAHLFQAIGCAVCHVDTLVTAPAGTPINGGQFIVPSALGDKIIHPFSDFLLHDLGTGDGIPQGSASGGQFRTPPLWGLRTRTRFMHDGLSLAPLDAVLRHGGEAVGAKRSVRRLRAQALAQLLVFLRSL